MKVIALAVSLSAGAALAETAPIAAVTSEINGREVAVSGRFGVERHIATGVYMLVDETGVRYRVELALDRDALAKVRNCKLEPFEADSGCKVDMKAEIAVRGSDIELVAFEVRPR